MLLMISSLVLLLAFQVVWVINSYENAFYDFRRDTNLLFKNTVTNMRLNTFMTNMVELKQDTTDSLSVEAKSTRMMVYEFDTLKFRRRAVRTPESKKNVQIYIESSDGNRKIDQIHVREIKDTMRHVNHEPTFIVRLKADSLSTDSIATHYLAALSQAKIHARFQVLHFKPESEFNGPDQGPIADIIEDKDFNIRPAPEERKIRFSLYADTIHSDPVRYSPFQVYSAKIFDVRGIILKEITPQIFFSIFLTCMIAAAFLVMFRSLRAQQKLMDIKNDFISNVTHELKTPVATVSVALEALKNFNALDNPQRTAEYLEIAQNELRRLTLMTDKILKTSVFESKGVSMSFTEVQLDQLVEQVISSMKLILDERKIALNYNKTGTSYQLDGAAEHLTNVMYNLLDNAIKYSHEGSMIRVSLLADESLITLTVSDQGLGIEKQYQDKVFEKFFRVPSGDLHNIKGYGLGLSYVAGVIKNHHGSIDVDSEPGKGSTFTVKLPRKHVG